MTWLPDGKAYVEYLMAKHGQYAPLLNVYQAECARNRESVTPPDSHAPSLTNQQTCAVCHRGSRKVK